MHDFTVRYDFDTDREEYLIHITTGTHVEQICLFLLTESRWAARFAADGSFVLLRDQDRAVWDRTMIEEGQAIARACLRRNRPGPYQIQAAINAVHADAASIEETDWSQILALYDQLLAIWPTPVVALNRAIALAEVRGPGAALAILDDLALGDYHLFHAARADLLQRLGRSSDAVLAYQRCRKHLSSVLGIGPSGETEALLRSIQGADC